MRKRTKQLTITGCWDSKNETMRKILEDFPYLWAIHSYWSCHESEKIKVSQDMGDLKLALSQRSMTTRFTFWTLTTEPCEPMNIRVKEITRDENATWAEAITKQTFDHLTILHLFLVGSPASDCADSEIIIFRNPNKTGLDDIIRMVTQLQGSITKKPFSSISSM